MCPGPLDLRHVTSVVDAGEAGRVAITAIARDVFGNEVGANLLGAAILPYGATAVPKTTDTGLGDRFEVPRPYAPPIRRGAEKAELAAAIAAAAASRAGTHAAMVAIVKSLFRAEEPAVEPATAPGGDDGIRVVAEATEGSSSSEVVLPPEWKAYLDKKEEKRVASARAEHRRESIEADTTPPSPLKGHQRASDDEGCAASSSGSSTGGSGSSTGGSSTGGSSCSNSQWFSGRGESLRSLVSGAGGWELPTPPLTDPLTGEQRTGRCTFSAHELTKAGTYWLLLWAENHAADPANPERAGANVDDLAPPTDKGARIVLLYFGTEPRVRFRH